MKNTEALSWGPKSPLFLVSQGTRHQKPTLRSLTLRLELRSSPSGFCPMKINKPERRADPTGRNHTSHWGALLCTKSAPWRERSNKDETTATCIQWFTFSLPFIWLCCPFIIIIPSYFFSFLFLSVILSFFIFFCFSSCFPLLPFSLLLLIICTMFSLHLTPFLSIFMSCLVSIHWANTVVFGQELICFIQGNV